MFVSPTVDLVLVAALFAVISQTIQLVLTNRREIRKTQKEMKEKNKELKELMNKKENLDKPAIERVQNDMMELTTRSMKHMPKMMIVNMIVFLPLFAMVTHAYNGTKVPLFFPFNLVWAQADWFWFYVLCSLLISMVVNHALTMFDDHHDQKKKV